MANVYRFKITLRGWRCEKLPAAYCMRTIEVPEDFTLEELANAILDSYEFFMDHCVGFYSNLGDYYRSDEIYTIFSDMPDMECPSGGKSVINTKMTDVFEKNKKMLFLFDYGEEWIFHVRCLSITPAKKGEEYPLLIDAKGKAPEQYTSLS